MVKELTSEELYKRLDEVFGKNWEVVRTDEGIREILFCVSEDEEIEE